MAWSPNKEYLDALIGMGINKTAAEHALFCTRNESVEAAATFVFDGAEGDEYGLDEEDAGASFDNLNLGDTGEEEEKNYKMVFVVNTSLNMGIGKIAAQVAHASLGLYRSLIQNEDMKRVLEEWEYNGEKKIVLKGNDHTHLFHLQETCTSNAIPSYLIRDAGHTQIPPDSVTVLSIFGEESQVNSVTGELKLL